MARANEVFGEASTEFCMYGYTQRTFTDARTHYRGVHRDSGIKVTGKTREAAVRAIAAVEKRHEKIKEAIVFLKQEGYHISRFV